MSLPATQPAAASSGSNAVATHNFGWHGLHDRQFWMVWLEHAIYFTLLALVLAEPFSTATVLIIFRLALGLWV
ncbi:MAG: hypothetical protein ACM34G_05485, partial [Acidobacteriota bacterium]